MWRALASMLPHVYLHNEDCELLSQSSFEDRYVGR